MWFDVEEKGNTTKPCARSASSELWFDVEEKGNTTFGFKVLIRFRLWFDVEEKGNTTLPASYLSVLCCGLM